jgi:hypothetical protein
MLDTSDMVGEFLVERHADAGDRTVEVRAPENARGYVATVAGKDLEFDILNMATASGALTRGSLIELGGDRKKRVTITKTPSGDRYGYVEVGER